MLVAALLVAVVHGHVLHGAGGYVAHGRVDGSGGGHPHALAVGACCLEEDSEEDYDILHILCFKTEPNHFLLINIFIFSIAVGQATNRNDGGC